MTLRLKSLIASFLMAIVALASNPWNDYDETRFMDMSFDENLETPKLDKGDRHGVRTYMRKLATELASKKYIVEMERDDEVIVITLPLEQLFEPNDTLLSARAVGKLRPLLTCFSEPARFKVLYSVHSDNTGSEEYNFNLSQLRVNSIYDWLLDNVDEELIIIPFAMGDSDPVADNSTRKGRQANRRLELYLVPGPQLITALRKH